MLDAELGEVGVVAQLVDVDVLELAAEVFDGAGQEVVGRGARGVDWPRTRRSMLVASKKPITMGKVRSPSTSLR